jgi:hypothetical protein
VPLPPHDRGFLRVHPPHDGVAGHPEVRGPTKISTIPHMRIPPIVPRKARSAGMFVPREVKSAVATLSKMPTTRMPHVTGKNA